MFSPKHLQSWTKVLGTLISFNALTPVLAVTGHAKITPQIPVLAVTSRKKSR